MRVRLVLFAVSMVILAASMRFDHLSSAAVARGMPAAFDVPSGHDHASLAQRTSSVGGGPFAPAVPRVELSLLVDGAKTPEKISDAVAYRQFTLSMAISLTNPKAAELARQTHVLKQVGLSPADREVFVASMSTAKYELDQLAVERNKLSLGSSNTAPLLASLKQREASILNGQRGELQRSLSSDGWQKLDSYVQQYVKPRVRIYGS